MSSIHDGPIFDPKLGDAESLAKIDAFLAENQGMLGGKDVYVGGWLNGKDGQFYIDASQNYQDRNAALQSAAEHHQIAVFDLNTYQEIRMHEYLQANPDFKVPAGGGWVYNAGIEKE